MIAVHIEQRSPWLQGGKQFDRLVYTIAKMQMHIREITHQPSPQFLDVFNVRNVRRQIYGVYLRINLERLGYPMKYSRGITDIGAPLKNHVRLPPKQRYGQQVQFARWIWPVAGPRQK